jgi:hypothetical protein
MKLKIRVINQWQIHCQKRNQWQIHCQKKEINGKYKVDKKEYPAKLRIDDSLS